MSAAIIEKQAADWFEKRMSGRWTEPDEASFATWLQASAAHEIQYLRIETAWQHAERLRAAGAGVVPGEIPPRDSWGDARFFRGTAPLRLGLAVPSPRDAQKQSPAPLRSRRRLLAFSATASVLAALCVYLYHTHAGAELYRTPVGAVQTLALQDGSQVTLGTDTSLRASFGRHERRIELTKGEVFFDVAKDPARSFIVQSGDRRIVAVGTKFAVRRDGQDVRVVVTEGKVRLEQGRAGAAGETAPLMLVSGTVARASRQAVKVDEKSRAEVEKLLSWRSGYVNFDNVPLTEAVAEFNRYRQPSISIDDPSIADLRIGGNFRADNSDAFLAVLEAGFAVRVERYDDRIVLRRRR